MCYPAWSVRNHLVYFFNPAFQEPVKGPFKKIVTRDGPGFIDRFTVSDVFG